MQKITIQDKHMTFKQGLLEQSLPVSEITWAYLRKEESNAKLCCCNMVLENQYLILHTKTNKCFKLEMEESRGKELLIDLKEANPGLLDYFPAGSLVKAETLINTRDLGGIRTEKGEMIRPGKLIRSGTLYQLTEADKKCLTQIHHLRVVLDLRTELEKSQKPDDVMDGVTNVFLPVLNEEAAGITREEDFLDRLIGLEGNAEEQMCAMYRNLMRYESAREQYRQFFSLLLNQEEGAILWHCSVGKDRAGTASALVLYALDVPMETIMQDYLRTNVYLEKEINRAVTDVTKQYHNEQIARDMKALFSVKETYLQNVFEEMKHISGSIDRFFANELGMDKSNRQKLKDKYLMKK